MAGRGEEGLLFWPAPSFSGGIGLACAVVPPAHPPTFLETGGLPLHLPAEHRTPCTLLGRRTGLCLIVCVTAFSSPPALRRRGAVTKALQAITSRYTAVMEPLPVVTRRYEPLLRWMAPKSLCHTAAVAPVPNLPQRVLPLGVFPQRPCHRGILYG